MLYHATGSRHDIHLNKIYHGYAKNSVRINLPNFVNNSTTEILEKVETHRLHVFSRYIKTTFIDSSVELCTTPNVLPEVNNQYIANTVRSKMNGVGAGEWN